MADTVQAIKDKLSIVEVISPYVKLTKAGRHYKGLSPFNKEKTPSFYVNPERGTYFCFSSGQGGDHFTFIEKMEGLDFKGAMKILAEKAGVEIEYSGTSEDKGKADRLREAMARAEAFYVRHLTEESGAYEYALSRGLTAETIRAWGMGYAPDAWRALLEELTAAGFSTKEMLDAGLIKEADGKPGTYYDRFRNRLMFPIRDSAGRTVAFTGRALAADDQAKYLNSPETDLFKKSQVLFGMDKAKDAIRTRGFALLVEGQFDVILLHQIGFGNAIALSGTALSREHLALMKRYADNLMLALDADRAGLAASAKNAHAALAAAMRVKAVRMPLGKDPADLAKETPADFTRRVAEAEPVIEFFMSVLTASESNAHRLVIAVEKVVLPLVAAIRSPLEREHFIGIIARRLGSSPDAVRASVPRAPAIPEDTASVDEGTESSSSAVRTSSDTLALQLQAITIAYPGTLLAKRVENEYARISGSPFGTELIPEQNIFAAGIDYGEQPGEHAADDTIGRFELAYIKDRLKDTRARLMRAEAAGEAGEIEEATRAYDELQKRRSLL